MRGQYVFWPGTPRELIVPNTLLDEGEESFIKMITQADVGDVAAGGNFYVGLCGSAFAETDTLATLAGEPTVTNGYAREAVTRDATGWPTLLSVGGKWMARTAQIDFTASGGDFSTSIWRAFLCNVASGSSGLLFSVSAALPAAELIENGETLPMHYELHLG